ncbi:late sexual development protein [Trematosphaeria pertusa]|uniref:Late sexual development protein n=1 Tax=Trematosphaeria pertusa TaxID=390896 RepID=A0A6A6IAB4_9PLEO|nr:late sexual development protein [Trematosphaeria pertusa]KAF2247189.1 late sexual development protein [Trematosphaeria pertusa]
MRSSIIYSAALLAGVASALPTNKRGDFSPDNVYFPLANGFPNPSQDQIMAIQKQADGTLPNGPPPPTLSPEGVTNLKLIALNELFEVAFYTELIYNVTNKLHGYDLGYGHEYVLDTLTAIQAQEELHLLNANGALQHFNQEPIQPCKYSFPVTDFQSAIALAGTFTDVVLGTLQDVNQIFAKNGDDGLVRAVSSVIGNEAEQEGFFRLVQKKRASSQPFLTTSARDFAFTAIQGFTVPGSCPNINTIPLKTFKPLAVVSQNIQPATQNIKFSFAKADAGTEDWASLSVVYINQQNVPIVKSLQNPNVEGDMVVFEAQFPFDEFLMHGLTIAAVTKGSGPFASADAVAEAAIFGPGLIEID